MNNNKNITVKQAIDRYIESKTAVLSPSTIYGYKKANQRYLYILHDVKIAKLDQELIQRAINKLSYCYSPKTVRNAYGLLHASLQMFAPDFVYRISLPQKIKSSFYVPDENEIKVIYKLIKNTELEIPFLLASQCGLRPSEICALTKDCITADGLEIRKAVVINEHGREVYKPPKSYAGYRTIPISPLLRDKLMNTPDKKRICVISSNKISRDWNSFLRKHGLHIFRFYSLRHYYASQALLLGIPQKYIAELMGHSSIDMIEKVYQHTFPSAMEEFKVRIADNIEKLLG